MSVIIPTTVNDALIFLGEHLQAEFPAGIAEVVVRGAELYIEKKDAKGAMNVMLRDFSDSETSSHRKRMIAWAGSLQYCANMFGEKLELNVVSATAKILAEQKIKSAPEIAKFAMELAKRMNKSSGLSEIVPEGEAGGR